MKNLLTPLLYICVGALLGTMLMKSCSNPKEITTEIIKTDTLTIVRVDTVVKIQPQPYKVVVKDTVYLQYPQNPQYPQGNLFVQEVKEYRDSTYYARVSGINAFLEEIQVYPRTTTKYINTTEKVYTEPKKWGLGVIGGVGWTNGGLQPYVGVGISWDIIQW